MGEGVNWNFRQLRYLLFERRAPKRAGRETSGSGSEMSSLPFPRRRLRRRLWIETPVCADRCASAALPSSRQGACRPPRDISGGGPSRRSVRR
jgi:hypothetical protein